MSLYSRRTLVDFLATRGPEFHLADDRLAFAARICCVLEILQSSREGWGPKLTERDETSAIRVANQMIGCLIGKDYSETLATTWADRLIARVREQLKEAA